MNKFQTLRSAAGTAAALGLATLANSAMAVSTIAAPDVSVVTDSLTGIAVVGGVVFGVFALVKGFHWIRRAL